MYSKERKVEVEVSGSEYESEGSKESSSASEDGEEELELSDDDLVKEASKMSEKDLKAMYSMEASTLLHGESCILSFSQQVKVLQAGELFNSDENVVSSTGPSRGSSKASGLHASKADVAHGADDAGDISPHPSRKHSKVCILIHSTI